MPVLPADTRISEGTGHMIVKYADGKPRRLTRRLATVAYAFGGFSGSDEFLVIELRASHRLVDPDCPPTRH
ncbi:hypothetical protein PC129_g10801 [Phytophthora cactorum]|uniref:Uncharacterized protein n=1 Tax=Phytophthora cactorum TaxID=29920 RepID=A0A8T1KX22_9STRA|nr:hypothetical protein PC112_g12316 [Phytophthora cactorum]KAG2820995.1 hypothetical protein PC111_g11219 [Phytophthora cactorum]KAG2854936.1 hypothetical protein PC113_g12877 [Phytophthora cactorum]KAG2900655.1 hypothetical protein PC114_g13471 [Phytophthora cactorum]KAG2921276.1 hypothetical protein PC115_g9572 [Phytophthora cactorum]